MAKSSLLQRLKKNSTIDEAQTLKTSSLFEYEPMPTEIPILNLALSGRFDGGLTPGMMMFAGESRTFKTGFLIQMAKAFQNKHPNGVVLFYDSEFSPLEYWESAGVNTEMVLHTPIKTVEQMKHDIAYQLDNLEKDDKVIILIDSVGGLPSAKEATDAIEKDEQPVDMTRAKALNSFCRIVTPIINQRKISLILINSFYDGMDKYAPRTYAGGKKLFLSCDDVWFMGRSKDKDGKEVVGFDFKITADKSRTIIEGSQFSININFENGIDKYAGLYDLAKDAGLIHVAGAWCKFVDLDTGELSDKNQRAKDVLTDEYYEKLLKNEQFNNYVNSKYTFG